MRSLLQEWLSIHAANSGDKPVTLNWRFSPVFTRPAPRGFCFVMGLLIGTSSLSKTTVFRTSKHCVKLLYG